MGEVVPFEAEGLNDSNNPRRAFRCACLILRVVVAIVAVVCAAFVVAVFFLGLAFGGAFISMGPDAAYLGSPPNLPGIVPLGTLPLATRFAYAATLILNTIPVLVVLAALRALLRLYGKGVLFGLENTRLVKQIAAGLFSYAMAPLVGRGLVLLAGHGVDVRWFSASMVHALLLSAVVFVVAAVMDAGHEAERDRAGFV